MTICPDASLREAIQGSALKAGQSVSDWLTEAAQFKLRNEALGEFLAEWQAEHGAFTEAEISHAEEELGLRRNGAA